MSEAAQMKRSGGGTDNLMMGWRFTMLRGPAGVRVLNGWKVNEERMDSSVVRGLLSSVECESSRVEVSVAVYPDN